MDTETDNPSGGEDTSVEDTLPAEQEPEQLFDDDGNPIEEEPEEEEEIDLDDVKLKLPKSQAEKVKAGVLRQADYTRKTQELAAQREALDADRDAVQQFKTSSEEERKAELNVHALSAQIEHYANVDWTASRQNARAIDAQNGNRAAMDAFDDAWQTYQGLLGAKTEAEKDLETKKQERQSVEQRETAKRIDQGREQLLKAIPDWSPEKAAKLTSAATQHFGFTAKELSQIDDPRIIIALAAAVEAQEAKTKAKKAQSILKAQEIQPAAKPARASAPPSGLDDRLSQEEWLKRRNAQLKARA